MSADPQLLAIGEVARRSGLAASALRYYDGRGLLGATRTSGGHRLFTAACCAGSRSSGRRRTSG